MKRLILTSLALLLFNISFASDISYNIGRRLSYWASSNSQRQALSYRIMSQLYPGESYTQLTRRIDSMPNDTATMQTFLMAIYDQLGADYAYASLRSAFTIEQMTFIDHYYETHGGTINRIRSEEERRKQSEEAKANGMNENIAARFTRYCDMNKNLRALVYSSLSDYGISTFGCTRAIDNFTKNLDYALNALVYIYDRSGGADRAYFILRDFLSGPEIDTFNSYYSVFASSGFKFFTNMYPA